MNWYGITRTYKAKVTIDDTYSGQEIVIKIPINIDASNPGGMSVITNEDYTGLYVQNPNGSIDKGNPLKP